MIFATALVAVVFKEVIFMKKFLLILTVCIMVCLCGCVPKEARLTDMSPQFIPLESFDKYSGLCYDKDTMIIYDQRIFLQLGLLSPFDSSNPMCFLH